MTNARLLWPRITRSVAETIFQTDVAQNIVPDARTTHPEMTYGTTGGRISASDVEQLRKAVLQVAERHGYLTESNRGAGGSAFDREVARVLVAEMDLSWDEAGQPGIWSFLSLVVLPDVTAWRWRGTADSTPTKVRWVCIDPTRHTWGRLWWQQTLCRDHIDILSKFNESELNQLFERTSFTRNRDFFLTFAFAIATNLGEAGRRPFIRDVAKRMRRRLAFIDTFSLDPFELQKIVDEVVGESLCALAA